MALELNEEAWADFDILINAYLDVSERILQKDKYLIPMAMVLKDGEPSFVALAPADDAANDIDTAEHLKAYRELLSGLPDNKHACILGYDIKIQHENYNDAIAIELEHKNGTHQKMLVPYRFKGILKKLEMGQSKLLDPEPSHILNV